MNILSHQYPAEEGILEEELEYDPERSLITNVRPSLDDEYYQDDNVDMLDPKFKFFEHKHPTAKE